MKCACWCTKKACRWKEILNLKIILPSDIEVYLIHDETRTQHPTRWSSSKSSKTICILFHVLPSLQTAIKLQFNQIYNKGRLFNYKGSTQTSEQTPSARWSKKWRARLSFKILKTAQSADELEHLLFLNFILLLTS